MSNVIPFDTAVDSLLNECITLTGLGRAEAAMVCGVSVPILRIVDESFERPPQSPQTWGEAKPTIIVDPENPPVGGPPEWIGWEDVEIEPSEDDDVVAVVCVLVRGKRKPVAKVWEDGLVNVYPLAFGADDGDIFLRGLRVAYELVGGGTCAS